MKNLLKSWLPSRRSRNTGRRIGLNTDPSVAAQLETLEDRALLSAVTARLTIFSDGTQVAIPADIGVVGGENISQIHTVDAAGNICIEPVGSEALEDQTLGDFFETWRTNAGDAGNNSDANFSASQLFTENTGGDNTIQVFVNGSVNTEFESYVIQDNDEIVIAFGSNPVISVNTNLGPIVIELFETQTPQTVENFLNYVNDGDYINSIFHRNAELSTNVPFVIQGGGFTTSATAFTNVNQFTSVPTDDPVQNEPGISNTRGTVAMAKLGGDPNSATSQFFVNLNDNGTTGAQLDTQNGGFTVFGQVLDLTTSDEIAALSNTNGGSPFTDLPLTADNDVVVVSSVEGLGAIAGVRFDDVDADGVFGTGDTALSGITVFIDANSNGTLDSGELSTTTDGGGQYQFQNVAPGSYDIVTVLTTGNVITTSPGSGLTAVEIGRTTTADLGETTIQPPSGVDLDDTSDTGTSQTDDLTNLNNTDSQSVLQFTVSGVVPGATVELFSDGVSIGSATAVGSTATITTNGTVQFADGTRSITATQRLQSVTSAVSSGLSINVNTTSPGSLTALPPATIPVSTLFTFDLESPDEGTVTYSLVNGPTGLTIDPGTGELEWTPTADQAMPHDFQIQMTDAAGNQTTADIQITVTTPVAAANDQYSVDENSTLTVDAAQGVLNNDDTGQNGALTAQLVDQPNNGTVTLNTDGSFVYIPTTGFFGTDTFTYEANDGAETTNVAQVVISVNQANSAPIGVSDEYAAAEDFILTVVAANSVLSNDTDADNDTLTASVVSQPTNGTLTFQDDGSFSYEPNLNFNGTDSFTYSVSDGQDSDEPITVTINVTAVNDAPVGVEDNYTVDEDAVLTVDVANGVLNNDSDVEGETLTPTVIGFPANGTLDFETDGSFTYTPNANFFGSDQFTYVVSDGTSDSSTVFARIEVAAIADAPTATDDTLTATANGEDQTLDVLANDTSEPDVDQALTITSVSAGSAGGTLTISDAADNILYTPATDFIGTETFTYTIEDTDGLTSTATGTIDVAVAAGTAVSSITGVAFVDANGNGVRDVGEFTIPGVQINLTGTTDDGTDVTETFITDTDGEWEFTTLEPGLYQLTQTQPAGYTDGTVESPGTTGENVVRDITLTGLNSVVANFGESHMNSEHASIRWRFASSFANGSTDFTNLMADAEDLEGNTALATAIRSSSDTVDNPNVTPVAADDAYSVAQNGILTVAAASGVLANDSDADFNDVLSVAIQTQPTNGVVVLEEDGSFVYTPNAGFSGTDSFTYFTTDQKSTASATVTITVAAASPTANGALPNAVDSVFSDAGDLLEAVSDQ